MYNLIVKEKNSIKTKHKILKNKIKKWKESSKFNMLYKNMTTYKKFS